MIQDGFCDINSQERQKRVEWRGDETLSRSIDLASASLSDYWSGGLKGGVQLER